MFIISSVSYGRISITLTSRNRENESVFYYYSPKSEKENEKKSLNEGDIYGPFVASRHPKHFDAVSCYIMVATKQFVLRKRS